MYVPKNSNFINYEELGVDGPSQLIHDQPQKILVTGPWRQRGNHIYREGDGAHFASRIPTGYILEGTDEKGMPILRKLAL